MDNVPIAQNGAKVTGFVSEHKEKRWLKVMVPVGSELSEPWRAGALWLPFEDRTGRQVLFVIKEKLNLRGSDEMKTEMDHEMDRQERQKAEKRLKSLNNRMHQIQQQLESLNELDMQKMMGKRLKANQKKRLKKRPGLLTERANLKLEIERLEKALAV